MLCHAIVFKHMKQSGLSGIIEAKKEEFATLLVKTLVGDRDKNLIVGDHQVVGTYLTCPAHH